MPVEDHPVHQSVKVGSEFRYGCHNADRSKTSYYAPDRVYDGDGGMYHICIRKVTNVMSKECRYDFRTTDKACGGCREVGQP